MIRNENEKTDFFFCVMICMLAMTLPAFARASNQLEDFDSMVHRCVLYMDPDSTEEFTIGSVDSSGDFEYVTESGRECFISHSFRGNPYA